LAVSYFFRRYATGFVHPAKDIPLFSIQVPTFLANSPDQGRTFGYAHHDLRPVLARNRSHDHSEIFPSRYQSLPRGRVPHLCAIAVMVRTFFDRRYASRKNAGKKRCRVRALAEMRTKQRCISRHDVGESLGVGTNSIGDFVQRVSVFKAM